MRGEDDWLLEPVEPLDDPGEPFGPHVRLPVHRDERRTRRARRRAARAPATARARSARRAGGRRPSRRRRRAARRRRLSLSSCRPTARPGRRAAATIRSTAIRLRSSGIERSKLRSPASTCASGVAPAASAPASVEFVSPKTSTQSGPSAVDRLADRRPHRLRVGGLEPEPVPRLLEPELLEEDVRELPVVVLPRVQHDLLDPRLPQRRGHRRRLDELRTVPDDREDAHGARLDTSRAVSSVGRAGDS